MTSSIKRNMFIYSLMEYMWWMRIQKIFKPNTFKTNLVSFDWEFSCCKTTLCTFILFLWLFFCQWSLQIILIRFIVYRHIVWFDFNILYIVIIHRNHFLAPYSFWFWAHIVQKLVNPFVFLYIYIYRAGGMLPIQKGRTTRLTVATYFYYHPCICEQPDLLNCNRTCNRIINAKTYN